LASMKIAAVLYFDVKLACQLFFAPFLQRT